MKITKWLTIGQDSIKTEPVIPTQSNLKDKKKFFDLLGGMFELNTGLSNETSVSPRLLTANREWVYRNNDVIAQEVSKMDFQLYSLGLKDGQINYKEIFEHPLLDLLDQFNPVTTKSDAIYNTQSHKKLTGDAFWLKEYNGNRIVALYQLDPTKIELILGDPNSERSQLVIGYKYVDTINGQRVAVTYEPNQILHFKKPNPKNMFRGLGAVEALVNTIDTDNLTNEVQKNLFKNGAITNFVLSTDQKVSNDQLKRLEMDMKRGHSGALNAFKMMLLGNGLKPVPISFSNKDMEFIKIMEWYRDKIMIGFGNTKASLGIIDDVNRASFESAYNSWLSTTVKPDMDAIANTLNEFLVPEFGKNLLLGYVNPVPEDRTDDITEATVLYSAGVITKNEARELLNYDQAKEGGDEYKNDFQFTPIAGKIYKTKKSSLPDGLNHFKINHLLRRRKIYTQLKLNQQIKEQIRPVIKKKLQPKKPQLKYTYSTQITDEVFLDYYGKQINLVDVFENRFEEEIKKFIAKIEKVVLNRFEREYAQKKILKKFKSLIDPEDYDDLAVEAQLDLMPILMQEVTLAGQNAYKLIGIEDTYIPYKIKEVIAGNVARFAKSMIDTDKEKLTGILTQGIDEGKSVPEIRNSITDEFKDLSKTQAERVTRTEVLRTNNLAAEDAFIQSGVVEAKQWSTAGDPCEECAPYDGEIVKLGGNFYDGENEFENGDPPLHPNCRCIILPIVMEE